MTRQPLFVAFGNPLMDLSLKINDATLLKEYGLDEDGQKELESERMTALLREISLRGGEWRSGGAASNSALAVAFVGSCAVLFGGAGEITSERLLREVGVVPRLQMHPTLPSGRCVCLYQDEHRSLVANIGAAAHFSVDFLTSSPENQEFLNDASMIFAEGFFLQNRFPVCQYVVEDVQQRRGKILAYNLGATYVIETLTDESKFMAENADVVFGNAAEYSRLGQICYSVDTAEECAVILHTKWRNSINVTIDSADLNNKEHATDSECKISRQRNKIGKILVVTDGDRRILIVDGRGATRKQWVDVPKLSSENIVDTTGAGDFFAAGFCWGIMKGYSSRTSAKFGCCLSAMNVANVGVIIPLQPPPNIEDFVDQEDEKDFPLESSFL